MTPLIIDSNNLAYIACHAFGEDLSHEEEQTGVMWGFFNQVWHLAKQFKTHKFLFAWDSRQSYRRQEFPAYKAGRHTESEPGIIASNDAIYGQFVKLRTELLHQFGFRNVFHCVGIEADDIIGDPLAEAITAGNVPRKLGYIGKKQFVRATVTGTAGGTTMILNGSYLMGVPHNAPTGA